MYIVIHCTNTVLAVEKHSPVLAAFVTEEIIIIMDQKNGKKQKNTGTNTDFSVQYIQRVQKMKNTDMNDEHGCVYPGVNIYTY
jgi:hypothetical protein